MSRMAMDPDSPGYSNDDPTFGMGAPTGDESREEGIAVAQYRKLPVIVEAEQWVRVEDGPHSFNGEAKLRVDQTMGPGPKWWAWSLWVIKSNAWCALEVGDWIVREHDGVGFYPCKAELFAATYEPVTPEPEARPHEPR